MIVFFLFLSGQPAALVYFYTRVWLLKAFKVAEVLPLAERGGAATATTACFCFLEMYSFVNVRIKTPALLHAAGQ